MGPACTIGTIKPSENKNRAIFLLIISLQKSDWSRLLKLTDCHYYSFFQSEQQGLARTLWREFFT
jgi:hypothetical protein